MADLVGLTDVVDFCRNKNDFIIVADYDADGITSSAVLGMALKRLGKDFKIFQSRALNYEKLDFVKGMGDNYIFMDFGSNIVSTLEKAFPEGNFAIIDHHKPEKTGNSPHFNVHLSGGDGSVDLCTSTSAYHVAKRLGDNKDLAAIAIVGAVADMQDSKGSLTGYNTEVVQDGIEAGVLEVKKDIRLFGRHSRPLTQFLSYSTDPFLPGLTGNEPACQKFIEDLGITLLKDGNWRYYCDLSLDEKQKFITGIYVYGKEHDLREASLKNMVGDVYELVKEPERTELRDAREFGTLLNACGRHDRPELGIKVCMGDRNQALKDARNVLQQHRRMLREGIEYVHEKGVQDRGSFYYMNGEDKIKHTLLGVIMGMLYGALVIKDDKPVLGSAMETPEKVKVSGRATWPLVNTGLDLSEVMEAANKLGGIGGGHNIAAGASIPKEKLEDFLKLANEIISRQMHVAEKA
jgi:RecJ-like exonuclease